MNRRVFGALVAFWGCTFGVAGCTAGNAPPPRVILVSIDTLRADHLGLYGYERDTSPFLDAFAREAVVFRGALSQSAFTLVSHHSLFTARYPLRLIRETNGADLAALASLEDPRGSLISTFAALRPAPLFEALRRKGYTTAAFTDGVWMSAEMGFDRGFDFFNAEGGHLAWILPRVFGWLDAHRSERFFLFIHTYDTHSPYHGSEPYNSRFCRDHSRHISLRMRCNQAQCGATPLMKLQLTDADLRAVTDHYDGAIARVDAALETLWRRLERLQLLAESLIIVISDHGESLGEHDQVGHGGLHLEQLRVPLIVKFPDSWRIPATTIEDPVELVDVMPTVYDALGMELPEGVDGRSLIPGHAEGIRRYSVAQTAFDEGRDTITNPAKRAILDPGHWFLIHDSRGASVTAFDLQHDERALQGEASPPSGVVTELLAGLESRNSTGSAGAGEVPRLEMSEKLKAELRALGYGTE